MVECLCGMTSTLILDSLVPGRSNFLYFRFRIISSLHVHNIVLPCSWVRLLLNANSAFHPHIPGYMLFLFGSYLEAHVVCFSFIFSRNKEETFSSHAQDCFFVLWKWIVVFDRARFRFRAIQNSHFLLGCWKIIFKILRECNLGLIWNKIIWEKTRE